MCAFMVSDMASSRDGLIRHLVQARLWFRRLRRRWYAPKILLDDGKRWERDDAFTKKRRYQPAALPVRTEREARALIVVALFTLALLVRAWDIAYPPSVVFDEVHFLRFVKGYYTGHYFFDIHPPLGKLILLLVTWLFCGEPKLEYSINGEEFGDQIYTPLRWTSALFGSAVAPVTYLISRELGLSVPAALVPALTCVFEHLAVVESRLVLLDAQLIFFMALCLWFALKLWGCRKGTRERRLYLVLTSLTGAAALSVKWTALATPALVGLVSLFGRPFPRQGRLKWSEMSLAAAIAVTVYVMLFWVHFMLLNKSGRGDAFMTLSFQKTLKGSRFYDEDHRGPGFIRNFLYLNRRMFTANRGIKARHRWESRWWQWMIDQRGLLYYNELDEEGSGMMRKIYLIVNPVAAFVALVSMISFVVIVALTYWRGRRTGVSMKVEAFAARGTFFFVGYVVNIVPYLEVSRCTFLYHYLPPLFYAMLGTANLIDLIPTKRHQVLVASTFIVALVVSFWIWSPWIYATPLGREGNRWRQLYGKHWK